MSGTFAPRLWVLCLTAAVALAAACPAQEARDAQGADNGPEGFSPPIDVHDFEDLAGRLRRAEAELARRALEPVPGLTGAELLSYESLHREIAASFYGELMDRSRFLVLLARAQAVAPPAPAGGAAPRIPRLDGEKREKRAKPARILLGAAVASFGLSFSLWAVAERQDSLYFASPTIDEATFHRRLYQVYGLSSLVLAGVGVLASGASVSLLLAGGR